MKIVVINGKPRSGKTTFCELCQAIKGNYCQNYSTVDFVKKIATECGWNGHKTAQHRKFLSDLKDLLTNWDDVPYKKIVRAIESFEEEAQEYGADSNKLLVFIHSREPKEIARFVNEMGAITLLIRRREVEEEETSNDSDANVFDYDYDYTIYNNGTLEDLKDKAEEFLNMIEHKE